MGKQGRQPSLCEFTILSVQVTASIEGDRGPEFGQEPHILLHPSEGGKRNSPMTDTTQGISAISVVFPLCRCTILDQSTDFQWSCHLPSNLFQTVTDRAWALPPSFLPPLHIPLSLMKATLTLSFVKGQCFQGENIGLYTCIWSKTFEMCTKAAKSGKEKDHCIKMS